jgi:hypothetical protein
LNRTGSFELDLTWTSRGRQGFLAEDQPTHVVTEGLLAESILGQRSFTLEANVSVGGIDEKTAVLGADTTVARACAGDRGSLHRELDSSAIAGAVVDSDFALGCHDVYVVVDGADSEQEIGSLYCLLVLRSHSDCYCKAENLAR